MKKLVAGISILALAGCGTVPVQFIESTAPVPMTGYTVCGSNVSGSSEQIWVLGFGGSLSVQQHKAYTEALGNAPGADALVGVSIEQSQCMIFPFFCSEKITLSGTPVKFNK